MADYPIITDAKDSDLSLLAQAIVQADSDMVRSRPSRALMANVSRIKVEMQNGMFNYVQIRAQHNQLQRNSAELVALWRTNMAAWTSELPAQSFYFMHSVYGDIYRWGAANPNPTKYPNDLLNIQLTEDRLAPIFTGERPLRSLDINNYPSTEKVTDYLAGRQDWATTVNNKITDLDARIARLEG